MTHTDIFSPVDPGFTETTPRTKPSDIHLPQIRTPLKSEIIRSNSEDALPSDGTIPSQYTAAQGEVKKKASNHTFCVDRNGVAIARAADGSSHSLREEYKAWQNGKKSQQSPLEPSQKLESRVDLSATPYHHSTSTHMMETHKRKQSEVEPSLELSTTGDKMLKRSTEGMREEISRADALPASISSVGKKEHLQPSTEQISMLDNTRDHTAPPHKTLAPSSNRNPVSTFDPVIKKSETTTKAFPVPTIPQFRPRINTRNLSTPSYMERSPSPSKHGMRRFRGGEHKDMSKPLQFESSVLHLKPTPVDSGLLSPIPASIPLPPLSLPAYLQLELSSKRPPSLYIHRSSADDSPYESSGAKTERLLNFLLLPPQLEAALWFGTLACFDAWLYTFTILPLRLMKSFYVLGQSWASKLASEAQFVSNFIYNGSGRMWRRRRTRGASETRPTPASREEASTFEMRIPEPDYSKHSHHHKRAVSTPSSLLPDDKADMLKGLLVICTCLVLLRLDASRMYHWIRGQAVIKLYVIYNVLEVCDRLFSAIGQDVLECLFSRETLERKENGHSKIMRPLWLFLLALIYTVIHSTALFYQVITLNVAVNSYSNALITLLMSNQFVEIKSTVFKKFEKENLFQLTCADVVERFQLWLMLTIIASRNIVETGGLSSSIAYLGSSPPGLSSSIPTPLSTQTGAPPSSYSILPKAFTLLPTFLSSLTAYAPPIAHVLGPFLVVLGSEMLVDWVKHAYIGKFNNTRPALYGRFLDVLAKDYYSNAFTDQSLTKRLGLPVIPLSCLFIRAMVQTYQMFLAAWVPVPAPSSAARHPSIHNAYTISRNSTPTSTAAAISQSFDDLLAQIPKVITTSTAWINFTTILIFTLGFLVLLALKLVLGILLLSFARARYRSMKEREKAPVHHVEGGKRLGGWGVVEVDEDKRRWIYKDDAAGLRTLREREERQRVKHDKAAGEVFDRVKRYDMVAKRIW